MGIELYKTANAQTSFICEAILGNADKDGRVYNKVALVLVLRDQADKAVKTLRYYLDIPSIKVFCHDFWDERLTQEVNEYKKTSKAERALKITPKNDFGYRIAIMNNIDGKKESLYFDLSSFQARQLAITVLDYLRAHELATALAEVLKK